MMFLHLGQKLHFKDTINEEKSVLIKYLKWIGEFKKDKICESFSYPASLPTLMKNAIEIISFCGDGSIEF